MLAIQQPSSAFNNNAPSFPWVLDNIFPEGDSSLGMGDSGQGDDPIKRDEGGAWGYGDYAWDSFLMQARPLEGGERQSSPKLDAGPSLVTKKLRRSTKRAICQVDGCAKDLSEEKSYLQRYSVCERHFKADSVLLNGRTVRFCQQCNKFQDVTDFEGSRRSCAARSKDRNMRRRMQNARAKAANSDEAYVGHSPVRGRHSDGDSGAGKRSPSDSYYPSNSADSRGDDYDMRARSAQPWLAGGQIAPLQPMVRASTADSSYHRVGAAAGGIQLPQGYSRSSYGNNELGGSPNLPAGLSVASNITGVRGQDMMDMGGMSSAGPVLQGMGRLQGQPQLRVAGGGLGGIAEVNAPPAPFSMGLSRSDMRSLGLSSGDLASGDIALLRSQQQQAELMTTGRGFAGPGGQPVLPEVLMQQQPRGVLSGADARFLGASGSQGLTAGDIMMGGAAGFSQGGSDLGFMMQDIGALPQQLPRGGAGPSSVPRMRPTSLLPSSNALAAQLAHVDHDFILTRVCLKLLACTPAELPDDMLTRLRLWMNSADSELMQAFIRPGCTHVIVNLSHPGDAESIAKALFAGGNVEAAVQQMKAALGASLLNGRTVTVQASNKAMYVVNNQASRFVENIQESCTPDIVRAHPVALRAGEETIVTVEGRNLRRSGVRFFARYQGKDHPLAIVPELSRSGSIALRVPALPRTGFVVIEAARMELLGEWVPLVVMDDAEEAAELNTWARSAEAKNRNWLLTGLGQILDYTSTVPRILSQLGPAAPSAPYPVDASRLDAEQAIDSYMLTPAELARLVAAQPGMARTPGVNTTPSMGAAEQVIPALGVSLSQVHPLSADTPAGASSSAEPPSELLAELLAIQAGHHAASRPRPIPVNPRVPADSDNCLDTDLRDRDNTPGSWSSTPGGSFRATVPQDAWAEGLEAEGQPERTSNQSNQSGSNANAESGAYADDTERADKNNTDAAGAVQAQQQSLQQQAVLAAAAAAVQQQQQAQQQLPVRPRLALEHPLLQPGTVQALQRKAYKLLVYATSVGLPFIATHILEFIMNSGKSFRAAMNCASAVLLDLQEAYDSSNVDGVQPAEVQLNRALQRSSSTNSRNSSASGDVGYSLLHTAVESGHIHMVEQVLDWGDCEDAQWNVAQRGPADITPLHCAAALPSGSTAKLLLARGPDARAAWFAARNADGDTAADIAEASGKAWLNDFCRTFDEYQQQEAQAEAEAGQQGVGQGQVAKGAAESPRAASVGSLSLPAWLVVFAIMLVLLSVLLKKFVL